MPSGAETLARTAAHREERRRKAAARRRRRRGLLVLGVLLVLLSPAIYSYAHWMLRPSSTPFFANSVEWVRADVPFGNQVVDEIEHIYYSWNAPSKGGPQLTSLPQTGQAVRVVQERTSGHGRRGSSRSSTTRCRARGSGNRPARR